MGVVLGAVRAPIGETLMASRERLAVIGAGVAGTTAAYLLQRRYDVTLFEAEDRLGGHAHTHRVITATGDEIAVDSGFIVFNNITYPMLTRLFDEIGIDSVETRMGMSIRCEGCGLVYAGGGGLAGLLASPRTTVRPRFAAMLGEVVRFQRAALRWLAAGNDEQTLGQFLATGRYSPYFQGHYILPVVSAVWSAGPVTAREYPARYLFRFLDNHGMLERRSSLRWRTIPGGSYRYVERLAKELSATVTCTPVRSVTRHFDVVEVRDESDQQHIFDHLVIATHADSALGLLADPTREEQSVLGAFTYSTNDVVLHTDSRLLPAQKSARASWNYCLPSCWADERDVVVSYYMNRLQHLQGQDEYLVSLNAHERVHPAAVVARMTYEHPVYTTRSLKAQSRLPELNQGRTAFAGAYHGWGFHEDGCRSGVNAAAFFGVNW
jgi:predicted NAD/FAD-binding protein